MTIPYNASSFSISEYIKESFDSEPNPAYIKRQRIQFDNNSLESIDPNITDVDTDSSVIHFRKTSIDNLIKKKTNT